MGVEKKKLIKMVQESAAQEDRAIQIYSRHLKTALFWSGLAAPAREQLRIQLGILEKESARHMKALVELRRTIEEDQRDAF